jgi:hypothetical protein
VVNKAVPHTCIGAAGRAHPTIFILHSTRRDKSQRKNIRTRSHHTDSSVAADEL